MGSCLTKKQQQESQEITTTTINIEEKYTFGRRLGNGASGRVIQALDNENKENTVAIKIMSKEKSRFQFFNEIKILSHLQKYNSKQNIIRLISHGQDNDNYYIIMNLCQGAELHTLLHENKLTEKISQSIIKQLLTIIDDLHQQNIVHRDIRTANILLKSTCTETNSDIVLIDFATAEFVDDNKEYNDMCGTEYNPFHYTPWQVQVYYVAPEMVLSKDVPTTGKLWKCADIWSIGIVTYLMLMKKYPFTGINNKKIFNNIINETLRFSGKLVSACCRDFISKLLVKNPFKRMTIAAALRHPWIQGIDSKEFVLNKDVYRYMEQFEYQSKLKRAIARCLGDNMSASPEQEVRLHFDRLDFDKDGYLGINDLKQMLLNIGFDENKALKEANLMLSVHSVNESIDFLDFKAVWHRKLLSKHDRYIQRVFSVFDDNGDEYIDFAELHAILGGDEQEMKRMFAACDKDNDGKLSFQEFENAMKEQIIDPSMLEKEAEMVITGYCGQIKIDQIVPKPIVNVIFDYYCLLYIPS